jgi:hypothetical protein
MKKLPAGYIIDITVPSTKGLMPIVVRRCLRNWARDFPSQFPWHNAAIKMQEGTITVTTLTPLDEPEELLSRSVKRELGFSQGHLSW